MRWAQVTDIGLVRNLNEDSLLISANIGLFAVADGMGGHRAGEVASATALQLVERELTSRLNAGDNPGAALINSIKEASCSVYEISRRSPELMGMGTTVTACLIRDKEAYIAQVGDSRAYLLRSGKIIRLTEDHSLVQELVKKGGISEEQALIHPQRNVLTRALGTESVLEVDLYRFDIGPGDILLLCTDGLTGYLLPEELLHTVQESMDLDAAARKLLEKALGYGGADNITIILIGL